MNQADMNYKQLPVPYILTINYLALRTFLKLLEADKFVFVNNKTETNQTLGFHSHTLPLVGGVKETVEAGG